MPDKCPYCPALLDKDGDAYECGNMKAVHGWTLRKPRCWQNQVDDLRAKLQEAERENKRLRDILLMCKNHFGLMDFAPGMLPHPELDGYCAYCKQNLEHREVALAALAEPPATAGEGQSR